MPREELLKTLMKTVSLLDDKQLEKATVSLEAIAHSERGPPPIFADDRSINSMSHVEFVTELTTMIRTGEDTV